MPRHHRQPRLARAKAAAGIVFRPNHWRATAIAALELGPEFDAVGVLQIFKGNFSLGQAQFFALIEADRPAQADQQRDIGARARIRQAPTGDMAHGVVVGIRPAGPSIRRHRIHPRKGFHQKIRRQPLGLQHLEGVAHLHLIPTRGIFGHNFEPALRVAHLAHRSRAKGVQHGAEFLKKLQIFRLVFVKQM